MIHPSAFVSEKASIAEDVSIGPFSVVHDHVVLSSGVSIGAYCEIGLPTPLAKDQRLVIGANSNIRSHSVIYSGSEIGAGFQTGHYASVRENSLLGEYCQLGSRGDIQGDCVIGRYTKMHADVHVGKQSKIGDFVWMFPEVLLTNDPMPPSEDLVGAVIEDYVVLAAKVLVMPGVVVGRDTVVGAGSVVRVSLPAEKMAAGDPAKPVCNAKILRMPSNPAQKAYPWRKRFHRGYSQSDIQAWLGE